MKLIKNELNKLFNIKYLIIALLIICTVFIIFNYNKGKSNVNEILNTSYYVIPFIGILICPLFGGIMSNEFYSGTIRMYLTKPKRRWKILLSKYISMLIITGYLLLILLISYILFESLYFDIKLIDVLRFIKKFIIYSTPLLFMTNFILFLSTIFSTSFSVGISSFIYLLGGIISQILYGIKVNIVEYTPLPYLDFTIFNNKHELNVMNTELGINMNINKAIIILVIFSILIYLLTNYIFNKKDIKY